MFSFFHTAVITAFLMLTLSSCQAADDTAQGAAENFPAGGTAATVGGTSPAAADHAPAPSSTEETTMELIINGSAFYAVLEDNDTAAALMALFPVTLDMSELNGNEKYHYLDTALPCAPEKVGHISAGDIMLYGDNCLVVFYESFDTKYTYTKIGHIRDTAGLADALGTGSVSVSFGTGSAAQ